MDKYFIKSVLGFNLKIDIKDQNGIVIPAGFKTTIASYKHRDFINSCTFDKSFFTNFDEGLLNKIRNYKRINE